MRKSYLAMIVAGCLVAGVGLGMVINRFRHASEAQTQNDTDASTTVTPLPPIRAVHVSGIPSAQDYARLSKLGITCVVADSPKAGLYGLTRTAHQAGMQVFYMPQMKNLPAEELRSLASLASASKVDLFGLGNGLADPGADEDAWIKQIKFIRRIYSGRIAFVSDEINYPYVTWWDAVDVIAVTGPFDLPKNHDVTDDQLRAAWTTHLMNLRSLCFRENKPLLLLNVIPPKKSYSEQDLDALATAAEALRAESWFMGLAIPSTAPAADERITAAWHVAK